MSVTEVLFELLKAVVAKAISQQGTKTIEGFFVRRRIDSKIDDAVASVVESLVPFFHTEKLSELQQELLFRTFASEVESLLISPQQIFQSSLDGQRLYDLIYKNRSVPIEIERENLAHVYSLIFPQLANLICALPPVIDQWRVEGYKEGFKRLDDISDTLRGMMIRLDASSEAASFLQDRVFAKLRQSLLQRVGFQLDMTGLRGDRPDALPLEKLFVVPAISEISNEKKPHNSSVFSNEQQILACFHKSSGRYCLIGSPGAGKSTFGLWLQRQVLSGPPNSTAILFRLRELARRDVLPSLLELIKETAGTHLRDEIVPEHVNHWIQKSALLVILDGFDEVPPHLRGNMEQWISELDLVLDSSRLVVTTRPLSTDHLTTIRYQLRLEPFDAARVNEYTERWYAHAPLLKSDQRAIDTQTLTNSWLEDPVLQPLISVPLMLATVLMVHHMDGALPTGRSKLYERYMNGMLGLWDSRWGVPSAVSISTEQKKIALMRLAMHMQSQQVEELSDEEITSFFGAVLPALGCAAKVDEVLDHLRERTGLLVGPGTWSFVHKSVGEFFVAVAINEGSYFSLAGERYDKLKLFNERDNDRWNSIIFFWAGHTTIGELQAFINELIKLDLPASLALAGGLILDQSAPYRLSVEWMRPKVILILGSQQFGVKWIHPPMMLNQVKDIPSENIFSFFVLTQLPLSMASVIPADDINLRAMGESYRFFGVSELAMVAKLKWEDLPKCNPGVSIDLWIAYLQKVEDSQQMKLLLKECNGGRLASEWIGYALTTGMRNACLGEQGLSLCEFAMALESEFPSLSNQMVVWLLGALFSVIDDESRRFYGGDFQISIFGDALERWGQRPVDIALLAETRRWVGEEGFPDHDETLTTDLLVALKGVLEKEPFFLAGTDQLPAVKRCVEELLILRDA